MALGKDGVDPFGDNLLAIQRMHIHAIFDSHMARNRVSLLQQCIAGNPGNSPALQTIRNRIASITPALWQLWQLWQTNNLQQLLPGKFIKKPGENLLPGIDTADRISLLVRGDGRPGLQQIVPCAPLVNALLTNALKHAFRDDGVGMNPERTNGPASSLGMRPVNRLAA